MLQGINIVVPAALLPLAAVAALLAPPLRKATPEKSLRPPGDPDSTVCTTLLVFPRQPHQLLQLLGEMAAEIYLAEGVQEARQRLCQPTSYNLLIVDAELPDGSWQDLLPFVCDHERPCEMIVCSRLGDERLWVEVMAQGAFDLIAEPFEESEVLRIIQGALDSQSLRRSTRKAA